MSASKPLATTTTTTTILWILVSTIYGLATVTGENVNGHPEHAIGSMPQQQQLQHEPLLVPAKRSWQNLQGSWGKRAQDHVVDSGDGSRTSNTQDYIDDLQSLYEHSYGGGGASSGAADAVDFERNLLASLYLDDIVDGQQQATNAAKRAWKSMNNGGWGKRIGG